MSDPTAAQENTDYVGDPVESGQDLLSNTPTPDEDADVDPNAPPSNTNDDGLPDDQPAAT